MAARSRLSVCYDSKTIPSGKPVATSLPCRHAACLFVSSFSLSSVLCDSHRYLYFFTTPDWVAPHMCHVLVPITSHSPSFVHAYLSLMHFSFLVAESHDIENSVWRADPPMPSKRCYLAAAVL